MVALWIFVFIFSIVSQNTLTKKAKETPSWAQKNIMDFNEADMERILDQWEEDEEELPVDELPEYKRPPPVQPDFNFDKMGSYSPDDLMKLTKKGKTVMMFVNINRNPSRQECEDLSNIWQGALRNDHIQAERYVIDDSRAIFLFHDGSQAWDAKAYFLEQERVKDVTLEGQVHPGKFNKENSKEEL